MVTPSSGDPSLDQHEQGSPAGPAPYAHCFLGVLHCLGLRASAATFASAAAALAFLLVAGFALAFSVRCAFSTPARELADGPVSLQDETNKRAATARAIPATIFIDIR